MIKGGAKYLLKELKTAINHQEKVRVRTSDGSITVGLPKYSVDPGRVKIQADDGVVSIPLAKINHVMRIIEFL